MLDLLAIEQDKSIGRCFSIITPLNPEERGAQISVLLKPGLLDSVAESLEADGVVVDERRPDVIRVAPAPLYNSFTDVFNFIEVFRLACQKAMKGSDSTPQSLTADGGKKSKGWSEIK